MNILTPKRQLYLCKKNVHLIRKSTKFINPDIIKKRMKNIKCLITGSIITKIYYLFDSTLAL